MLGAFLNSSLPRIIPIGMILLALQKTLFVELKPFGVIVQLLMAFAASAGAAGGPERGVYVGFVMGIMFDLSLGTPLGVSAIAMGLAGYVAGWADLIRIDTTWWLAAIFVGVGSGVGEASVPLVRRFVGEADAIDAFVPDMATIIPVVAVSAAIASLVLVPLSRWALKLERPEWKLPAEDRST